MGGKSAVGTENALFRPSNLGTLSLRLPCLNPADEKAGEGSGQFLNLRTDRTGKTAMRRKNMIGNGKGTRILTSMTVLALVFCLGFCPYAGAAIQKKKVFDCRYVPKTGEGYAGYAVHVHNADCFDAYYERICELPVIPPHVHDASCYDKDGTVICGKLELHTHSEECYEDGTLICGKLELEEHVHGPECFRTVIVDVDRETGIETIISEPTADLETPEDWEKLRSEVTLTGDYREDLLAFAESQLGYTRSETNIATEGEFKGGHYTRYGDWYGYPYGAWCAMFVSFCLHYAGIPEDVFPYNSGTVDWVNTLKQRGLFADARDHEPVPGDIVFFDYNDGRADHVGIVTGVEDGTLHTIEGNHTIRVEEFEYANFRDINLILGYGILPQE